jgi:peptide/nickel transport system substrate-binding protein
VKTVTAGPFLAGQVTHTQGVHTVVRRRSRSFRRSWLAAGALSFAVIAAACGGGDGEGGSGGSGGGGDAEAGKPVYGGSVVYGLEAENSGGWCLPEGQLAIAGIQVARTIYDTLTAPDENGEYQPFLAQSVEPNEDYTQWTITLRDGVKFHDGSPLTAEVVKNNLDAYRGAYPARKPLLFIFVLDNIADVSVVDPLTVQVTTKSPWPAFPAYLHSSGRLGMIAQAQLDDPETCDRNLIGTGPFKLKEWKVNDHLTAVRNTDYWQKDADGNQLPYLDEITYRPIPDGDARVNALLAEELNAMHTATPENIDRLRTEADNGKVAVNESDKFAEVTYVMFNASKPPFDNINARLAAAHAVDRDAFNEVRNLGLTKVASGPFAPGSVGYLEDAGFPTYDLDKAKDYAAKYTQETGLPLEITVLSTPDPSTVKSAQFIQEQVEKAGFKVNLKTVEQAALINNALGSDWNAMAWRNHPGGAPDLQYVWWKSGSPVNFGKFNDPEMDALLDAGRLESDSDKAAAIYQDVNRRFGSQVWNAWLNWTIWDVATAPSVHGVFGPDLPDGGKPFPGLATGHPVSGMWISQD